MIFEQTKIAVAVVLAATSGFAMAELNQNMQVWFSAGAFAGNGDWNISEANTSKIQIKTADESNGLIVTAEGFEGSKNFGAVTNYGKIDGDFQLLKLNLVDSKFTGNKSTGGSALTIYNGANEGQSPNNEHVITNSVFSNNESVNSGGAVSLHSDDGNNLDGSVTFVNTEFTGNKTTGGNTTALGGALFGEGTKVVTKGGKFDGNEAYSGGAVSLGEGTTFDVTGTTFTGNTAAQRGGAIYTSGTTDISVDGATFSKNHSGNAGGAIAISNFAEGLNPETVIKNTVFEENTSVRKGGAIVIFDMETDLGNTNAVTVTDSTFRNNSVSNGTGGALMVEESVTITGNTLFEGNSAAGDAANGGAVYAAEGSTVTLNAGEGNEIIFRNNNVNGEGNDMYVAAGSETKMTGAGSIAMNSGLAGAGTVTSNAENVYVSDVSGFTGTLDVTGGVMTIDVSGYLDSETQVFGNGADVKVNGGEMNLMGVGRTGTIQLVDETGSVSGTENITFDNGFLTGSMDENGVLTVKTDTQVISDSDFGSDSEEIAKNLEELFRYGASARERDIFTRLTKDYMQNGRLGKAGVEAFRQATGGSVTAGAFNVAYDAQTQFTDSIVRHQNGVHNGYGAWADVYYTSNEAKTLYGSSGYETDIYGGVFGFDATFSCGATAGIAVTVGTGDTDTVGELRSNLDTDFYGVALYTSKDFGGLDAKLDVGYMKFDNSFSGLGDAGDVDAWTVGLRGDFKAYQGEVMNITPHVGVRYSHFESDAVAFNDKTTLNVFETPVGVAFNGNFETAGWKIVPTLDFSIVPQLGDKDVDTFAGNVDVIDNLYNTTLGVVATYQNLTFGLDYRYGFGNEERSNNAVNLKVRYSF